MVLWYKNDSFFFFFVIDGIVNLILNKMPLEAKIYKISSQRNGGICSGVFENSFSLIKLHYNTIIFCVTGSTFLLSSYLMNSVFGVVSSNQWKYY